MSLSVLFLAAFLLLVGCSWVGLFAVPVLILGIIAIIDGILWLLEGSAVFTYRIGR